MKNQFRSVTLATTLLMMSISACSQVSDIETGSSDSTIDTQLVTKGVDVPWGMAWINKTDFLVTDRKGELRLVKNGKLLTDPVSGVPEVVAKSQGGLLDVEVDPNFDKNSLVYLSYSGAGISGTNTFIMRAKLSGQALTEQKVIFQGSPATTSGHHFGSRIEFDKKGYLYFSIGDRGNRDENPQRLDRDAGKIHRIHSDGRIPQDNPFVATQGANPSIYSYGHRNPQGMAMHPQTGRIWTHEHGPRGGDEINLITAGLNYGWPVISYGVNYSGTSFTDLTEKEGMQQPVLHWTPSIAPSGLTFVTSDKYPQWKGKMLVGSLKFQHLVLVELDGDKVVRQSKILEGIGRVRSLKQGADGYIYVGTDGTGIFKLVPTI